MLNREAFEAWLNSDGSVKFDLYAQNISEWAFLQEVIPGIVISSAGGWFPFQAEGILQGYPFYFRSEQGSSSLKLGNPDDPESCYLLYNSLYYAKYDMEVKTFEDFVLCLVKIVPLLQRSPFLWRFKARKFSGSFQVPVIEDSWDEVVGWGYTPDEGYFTSGEPSLYLESVGVSKDAQTALWLAREVSTEPLNEDPRVWSDVDPDFKVNV